VVPIGVLPRKTTSFLTVVRAVNNREHVVGYSYLYSGNLFLTGQGFLWQDGQLQALPLLQGWPGAFAFGINDQDQVVGTANGIDGSGNGIQAAVLWHHGQPVNLGGLHAADGCVAAFDVNSQGVVVGVSGPCNGPSIPVVWSGGRVQALPLLPGETGGLAEEINAQGVIAGWQGSPTNLIPCLWYQDRHGYTAVNLGNSLGGNVGRVWGINNRDQAVGYSLYPNGIHGRGVVWDDQQVLELLSPLPGDTDEFGWNLKQRRPDCRA
jgi:uncharacterized membrane protein